MVNANATFESLIASLAGAPALVGARCRGRGHLFDLAARGENPETVAARHNQAVGLCQHCPALERCRAWVDSLPRSKRPEGVVAGRAPMSKRLANEASQ
jgi:WhiB family redox-sensing transcriptional regulator